MINYFKTLNWQKLTKLLFCLMGIYVIMVFGICVFKYLTYQYNALDLAIFNQVFYNTSFGRLFEFSIHPTLYLGDHFEIIILLLVPFYAICKSPLALLFLQTCFSALASIPLFLIARKYLNPWQVLLVIFLYLFNPVTWNIDIFEFHILALAPFFIFWTFYFYDQNKFRPFLLMASLCLLVREDVSFVIFMFGILAILDKKKIQWILTPLLLAPLYFLSALKIVGLFSAAKTYKFIAYYQWLGETPLEMIKNFFPRFPDVLAHIFTLPNFELTLGFLLTFLFIPLIRPKYLLLCLGMFCQLILGFATGELILRTHYGAILLAALSIAAIFSIQALAKNQKVLAYWQKNKDLVIILTIVALLYNFLVIGPAYFFIKELLTADYQSVQLKNEFIRQIPAGASVATTYELITNLSSRQQLYSLNYLFLGKQQYAAGDYILPDDTQFLLINFNDILTFHLQYEKAATKYYYQGDNNLSKLIQDHNFQLIKAEKNLALWQKDGQAQTTPLFQFYDASNLPEISQKFEQNLGQEIEVIGYNQKNEIQTLYFQALSLPAKNYFLRLDDQIYSAGYGLYPTSEWQAGQIIALNFFNLPRIKKIQLLDLQGGLELNNLGSTIDILDKKDVIGELNLE